MCKLSRKCGDARSRAFRQPNLPATRYGRSIRLSRHGLRMKGGEVGVDLSYGRGTLADAGRHALHRSAPYVSDRKNTGAAGCQRQLLIATGGDEALVVQGDTPIEPLRVGIGTDEQEHVPCVDPATVAALTAGHVDSFQFTICRTRQSGDGGADSQVDIGGRLDPVDQVARHGGIEARRADSQVYLARVRGEEDSRLPRRIASSDENDIAAFAQRRLDRRRPVRDAGCPEEVEVFDLWPPITRARRNHNRSTINRDAIIECDAVQRWLRTIKFD